ncbi:MAG: hypothetical protein OXM56_06960 [Gammaproteobacteria bacterium]|nr:hypothetical protein [Gammaproteobacteria bacterium]
MDYLMVSTWTMVGVESRTYVAGPDWFSGGGELALRIADRGSLQEGKAWLGLPDKTPTYCEVAMQAEDLPSEIFVEHTYRHEIHVFSAPKDRWTHERNAGVAGYFRELDRFYDPEFSRVTVSVRVNQAARSWLADYYAGLEREIEILEERLARLEESEGEWAEGADGVGPPIDIVAGEEHFLAVATAPAPGTRIPPGESGYFGIGSHTDSQHDAGLTAAAECRRQGGGNACFSNAEGKSLRGGCVGVAMAKWRDRDEDPERAYVVTGSSFRELVARDLRSRCESTAFSGKYENTVVEHSCDIVRITCAGNAIPADGNSGPRW